MEFSRDGDTLINGLNEAVDLEDNYLFPLLKSSDLGNCRIAIRKFVLVTQKHIGDDTSIIQSVAPKTWAYLERHSEKLDGRKSSIYRNRPRFSVFGIGSYAFAPWKVAISGLYKSFCFVVVPPWDQRPVMVDDTCYSIPCQSEEEAILLHWLLSSDMAMDFLRSLVFIDSKRPITVDALRRISFVELARALGKLVDLERFIQSEPISEDNGRQMTLLMEPKQEYQLMRSRKHPTELRRCPPPGPTKPRLNSSSSQFGLLFHTGAMPKCPKKYPTFFHRNKYSLIKAWVKRGHYTNLARTA